VNSTANEGSTSISWDGLSLYFYSTRPGGLGLADIYVSTRARVHGHDGDDDDDHH